MKKITFVLILIMQFTLSSYAQLKIFSGGNITMGSDTSPASSFKLHVKGNSVFSKYSTSLTSSAMIRGNNSWSSASSPDFTWYNSDQTGLFHPSGSEIGFSTGSNERARFFNGGVNFYGNITFASIPTTITSAAYIRGQNAYSSASDPDYTWLGNDRTGIFHPDADFIGFSTSSSERMRITNTGNLLVGTSYNGGYRVCIEAERDSSALSTITNFANDYGYAHVSYVNRELTKNWLVYYGERESFFVYGNGDIWYSGGWVTSDSTLKENIQTLQYAKNKILSLRGVSYNLKPTTLTNPLDTTTVLSTIPSKTVIGLIAQEVEQVVPEVVATNEKGVKGVSYQNLVALLIEAFKEQNTTIDSLKVQINQCCKANPNSGLLHHGIINSNNSVVPIDQARLDQNNPNPFNTKTEIHFYIPESARNKTLLVFDAQGNLLKQYLINEFGESKITINSNEFHAGMYLYSLVIDNFEIDTKRMILTN